MDKENLKSIYYANKEIERLKRRIEELETAVMSVTSINDGMPKNNNKISYILEDLIDTKELLRIEMQRLLMNKDTAEKYIASIPDTLVRLVLAYRYIDNLSWNQVAAHIGGGNTADSCRKIAERFLTLSSKKSPTSKAGDELRPTLDKVMDTCYTKISRNKRKVDI